MGLSTFLQNLMGGKTTPKDGTSLKELMDKGALLLDVRTPGEYQSGHVPKAKNVPHHLIDQKIESLTKDKEKPIILYCASGARSGAAARVLKNMGYSHVYNAGGYGSASRELE